MKILITTDWYKPVLNGVVTSVENLTKEKNIEEMFGFLAKISSKQKMLLVGDGPYRLELERKADALGVRKQLIFTGMFSPEQIPDYYAVGDIFISASNSETQGMTYMEAMASALPLLCRADDCLKDVITSETNGLLYHTKEEFLYHFEQLKNDFLYRNQMGIMGRKSIQKGYLIQAFANSCIQVYHEAIQRAGVCV